MINVIKNDFNTIFKKYGYPELFIKIGIDLGKMQLSSMSMKKALQSIYLDIV